MLRRSVSRTLARTLFVLALAQTGLTGCGTRREPPTAADHKTAGADLAYEVDGTAAGSGRAGASAGPVATGTVTTAVPATPTTSGTAALRKHGPPPPDGRFVGAYATPDMAHPADPQSGESFKNYRQHAWTDTATDRLSTFAADVDTASYTIVRRKLTEGGLPPAAAVRVEELVNYFTYAYPAASDPARPFAVHMDAAPSPFNPGRQIVRVGVTTRAKSARERKQANLVFLVDVSGSMQSADKLALAKRSLRILVDNLKDGDTVALVTYAGSTRVVLPATGLEHKAQILAALEDLDAGGSTAMASGIDLAYQEAMKGLTRGAESRVIILSDGDANVGPTSQAEILATISSKVKEGVTLSTIGFGQGNLKDETMEQLANKGNGNYFYIDGVSQAKRVFGEQLGATLEVVAQDVKLQVDFDPRAVARYRLIGYENRDLADDDFRDDQVDAGEIGAGHQVTALYEVELGAATHRKLPLATVRVRHKAPRGTKASEAAFTFDPARHASTFAAASSDFRFAFAVAAFADVLRGAEDAEHWNLAEVEKLAAAAAGADRDRQELVGLIARARALRGEPTAALAR